MKAESVNINAKFDRKILNIVGRNDLGLRYR